MGLVSALNPEFFSLVEPHQQEAPPIIPTDIEELEFEEAIPRSPGYGRRAIVMVMAMFLGVAVLGLLGLTFLQGSWWYSDGTDRPLDDASRLRVEAIRDLVNASGAAPEAAAWLDAALNPHAVPTDVRTYLIAAQEALRASGDPEWIEAGRELGEIVGVIRPYNPDATTTPYSPTLEWP
jgi:hypothetical protein